MSIEISVYIRPDKMVTPKQWKDAIVELGYDMQLDDDIDIKGFSGFLPVIHKGNSSGFEYYYDELDQEDIRKMELPSDFNIAITLRTGSDFEELACSSVAVAALCHATEGIIYEPEEAIYINHNECIEWAAGEYQAALKELAEPPPPLKKPWWKFW